MNFSIKKTVIGLAGGLLVAAQVSAAPIISWDWTLDSAWTDYNPKPGVTPSGVVSGVTDTGNGVWDTLTWGVGTNETGLNPGALPSSVIINNPNLDSTTASADTLVLVDQGNGTWTDQVNGTRFTHNNNVLTAGSATLTDMILTELFRIGPQFGPLGPGILSPFNAAFLETPNTNTLGQCTNAQTSLVPCDDLFVILNPSALSVSFPVGDGYTYTLDVTVDGLTPLGADCANFAGAQANCAGLITEEASSNEFQFLIRLTASKIPEPSILGLMGLGLLGLGYRRRQSKK
jgi:hypothetical protein